MIPISQYFPSIWAPLDCGWDLLIYMTQRIKDNMHILTICTQPQFGISVIHSQTDKENMLSTPTAILFSRNKNEIMLFAGKWWNKRASY